jgi:hypothetical protein
MCRLLLKMTLDARTDSTVDDWMARVLGVEHVHPSKPQKTHLEAREQRRLIFCGF